MSAPILASKLFIPPPRLKVILRPCLIERLNEGIHGKLCLVSAPAGFGKTTLVAEWVATCGLPVAWLSLDEGDKDPIRFLTYLVAALQTILPTVGERAAGLLQSPQPTAIESILTSLLNEISSVPDHFVLVLDDYHAIDSIPVDELLTFLVDHLPARMHVLIATREDPPLPLARLRARGQLTELRAADLRFSPVEAYDFLNQVMHLNLTTEDVSALETRTEGWIAGLQLAALAMQGREDVPDFIKAFTGSHRFVLDYLVEEVLQHQSEPVRSFLLQTSILGRLCPELCNAVAQREDGKEMLDVLERSNLFLIPLDDQRQWYRYHHLFAEVLQTYLIEAQPEQLFSLHQRASVWYEQNGYPADAIRHALAAKDFDRAAGLLELAWPAAEEGVLQSALWIGWVKTLPDEMFHTRPVLNVNYAYALLGIGEIEAAAVRFIDAERWLESETRLPGMIVVDQEQYKSLPETIAIGRAYIAQAFGNTQETIKYTSQVLELIPGGDAFRCEQAALMLGMAYWATGDLEAAERVFADHTLRLRKAGNISVAISTTVVLAEIRLAVGHLQEAIHSIEELIQLILDQGGLNYPDEADLHRELSDLYLEQWNLEGAAQHLQISKELGEKKELPVWRYRWCVSQARFKTSLDDLDGALDLLDDAEKFYIRTPLPDSQPILAMKARIWVAQGKLHKAMTWVQEQGLTQVDDLNYLREFDHITLAKVLIGQVQNDCDEDTLQAAMSLLSRLYQAAEGGKRIGSMIEILALQALAYQLQDNPTGAFEFLNRALILAEPEGYILPFVETGRPLADLLATMKVTDGNLRSQAFKFRLISAFDKKAENTIRKSSGGRNIPLSHSQPWVELLSERELEVLRLLRTDLSGPEIARECTVSLTTIRTHTQNIYTKLGVNNRRAAVRRAEELDLF